MATVQLETMQNVTEDFTMTGNSASSFENSTGIMLTQGAYVKHFLDYDIIATGRWIFRNSWKFVVPPGLFGNMMIILAMLKMKPFNSTSLFMLALASVDLSVNIFRIPFNLVVHLYTTTSCKVMWYLYNVFPVYSNYILFFWTLERVIAVQFPLQAGEWCTLKRTAIVIIATGIFSFAIMLAYPIAYILGPIGCTYSDDMLDFMLDVWYKIDSSIFIFIPMIVIFFSNVLIIIRLYQSTIRHRQMTSSEEGKKRRGKEQRNATITLVSVCVAFFLLHMPLAVYNLYSDKVFNTDDQESIANWGFVNMFGMSLMEVQNSVNFYLYFLTGRRYRQFTFSILLPCRKGSVEQSKITTKTANTGISGTSMPE